ncbi:hypothetical protein RHMOL_Rhmol07G0255900 [Rhododendron molle]|uniref:Uncharacterized protein n=1 Tax=Rhododendron molle TaxID=49168 RepID=A0ACC0N4N6_RHOML|nr:hypothetical protein RHMOL_Rhmol07G0255900 [Rhododendron molle]
MTTRKPSCCAICENSNLASICTVCVNYRLNEYNTTLKSLKTRRDLLYSKLSEVLVAKGKADDQLSWRVLQNEKLARFKEKLRLRREQYSQGKAKIEKLSHDLKVKYELLESAMTTLERNRVEKLEKLYPNLICTQSLGHMAITSERLHKQSVVIKQICKLFPQRRLNLDGERKDGSSGQYDQICNARLPRGLDPHSISSEELAASLGYMVQLLNLVVHNVAAPALHNSGFAVFQVHSAIIKYPGVENILVDVPSEVSTFEAFAKLLATLSSSKEVRSVFSLKVACSRSSKQVPHLNKSAWNMNSAISSSTLLESAHTLPVTIRSLWSALCRGLFGGSECACETGWALLQSATVVADGGGWWWLGGGDVGWCFSRDSNLPSSAASFLYATEPSDIGKNENLIEGWDLVEHPTFPPPPSQTEDVEHWVRAMIIDATKK